MFPALRHRLCRGLVRFPPSATASAEAWFAFRPSPMARFNVDEIVDVNVRFAFRPTERKEYDLGFLVP